MAIKSPTRLNTLPEIARELHELLYGELRPHFSDFHTLDVLLPDVDIKCCSVLFTKDCELQEAAEVLAGEIIRWVPQSCTVLNMLTGQKTGDISLYNLVRGGLSITLVTYGAMRRVTVYIEVPKCV